MTCRLCGKEIRDDVSICPYCGLRIEGKRKTLLQKGLNTVVRTIKDKCSRLLDSD